MKRAMTLKTRFILTSYCSIVISVFLICIVSYALIMAGATVSLIPLIILFLFTQKYFIESFASAGVKG